MARTRGRLHGVPWPNTEGSRGSLGVGAEGRRCQTSPALPARRAVSTAGFPGAAKGRRARSAGREGASERAATASRGTRAEHRPGLPASSRTAAWSQGRAPERPALAAACSLPFPFPGFSFPSLTSSRRIGRARQSLLQPRKFPSGLENPPSGRPLPAHVSSPPKSRERSVTISPPPHYRVRERERRRALQATALQTPLSSASPLHGLRRRAHLSLDCGL